MYAVISSGGKQYRVQEGLRLDIEKIPGEAGDEICFNRVLLIGGDASKPAIMGTPCVEGFKVLGTIEEQKRGEKISIIKFRRRKHYRRQQGHRQYYTRVKITQIAPLNADDN